MINVSHSQLVCISAMSAVFVRLDCKPSSQHTKPFIFILTMSFHEDQENNYTNIQGEFILST